MQQRRWQALVGGKWVDAADGRTFTVENPATGEVFAEVAHGTAADVDAAVSAARAAFNEDWRWRPARARAGLLLKIAEAIRANAAELGRLETLEMGKPIEQATMLDVRMAGDSFEYFAGLAQQLNGDVVLQGPITSYTVPEPYGVVAAIIPFNWPPIHFAAKAAPALAAGNTLVIKPGEQAPLSVLRLAEILDDILPDGVVNAVPGLGPETGAALVGHEGVDKISFTGSTATGRAVMRAAADRLTPALMELGGKNPFVVFPDADLDAAARGALEGMFFNQGEACTAASRILLHREIKDEFCRRFLPRVERLRVGDGMDETTDIGPMVTRAQQQRVLDYIAIGLEEGATIVAQGRLPSDPKLSGGFYVTPTVFDDVHIDMRIAQEEIFGPVAALSTFDSYEEAIRLANGVEFGLVAAVYTADLGKANRAARELDVGVVFVNNYNRNFLGMPFGGFKASGHGREHAPETLEEFVQSKAVRMPSGIGEIPEWGGVARTDPEEAS